MTRTVTRMRNEEESRNQRHICPLSSLAVVHDSASQYLTKLVFGMGRCHSATLLYAL